MCCTDDIFCLFLYTLLHRNLLRNLPLLPLPPSHTHTQRIACNVICLSPTLASLLVYFVVVYCKTGNRHKTKAVLPCLSLALTISTTCSLAAGVSPGGGHKVVEGERSVTKAKTTRTTLRLFNIPQHNSWSARYHEFHAPPLPEGAHVG